MNIETDQIGLWMAFAHAVQSPDPSTQNGAVIVCALDDDTCEIIGCGFNGPVGKYDTYRYRTDREYRLTVSEHAEWAAIKNVHRKGNAELLPNSTLYAVWAACEECAISIAGNYVGRLVSTANCYFKTPARWMDSTVAGEQFLKYQRIRHQKISLEYEPCREWLTNNLTEVQLSILRQPIVFNGRNWSPYLRIEPE